MEPGKPLWVALAWIEAHCVVPDGFKRGEPFKLYAYQGAYLRDFYAVREDAVWKPESPDLATAFVYRRGILVGPQKVGKNPLIAAQVTLEGVGPALFAGWAGTDEGYVCAEHGCRCGFEYHYEPGEPKGMAWPTPLIQITAFSEESTENTYDALRPMIELGPLADVIPKTGEEFIRLPGGGRIDTVTSSAQSRLGQRVTFVPQDEVGIWTPTNKMTRVADTQYRGLAGMGGRASLTTNAWDPAEGSVAQREYESAATDIARHFAQPPRTLSYGNKAERRKIHRTVYPPDVLKENNGHIDLDSIEAEAADLVEKDAAQAERFYGNRLVAGAGAAVDAAVWEDLSRRTGVSPGAYIGIGFDGSFSQDSTALIGCTPEGHSFVLGIWERPPGAPSGWRIPRLAVAAAVEEAFSKYRVGRMLCDPWKWETELEMWAEKHGEEVVLAFNTNQTTRHAAALSRWLTGISESTHTHDGDDRLRDHVLAAHLKKVRPTQTEDGRTLYVLAKGDDGRKIDAAVADVLAYEAAMTMPPAPPPFVSVYETRGVLSV